MITMDVKGLNELEQQLTASSEKVDTKVLRDAGCETLKVVEEDMKQHTGSGGASSIEYMHDSIETRASTRKGHGDTVVTLRVGLSKKHYMRVLAREFGAVKQAADPFIRPALDYNVQRVLRILTVEIRDGVQSRQRPLPII